MDFVEICEYNGFQAETHQVVTEDGYINVMHRVLKRGDSDSMVK